MPLVWVARRLTKLPGWKLPPAGWPVMAGAGGLVTGMVKVPEVLRPVLPANSHAWMVMGKLPACVGMPVIVSVLLFLKPVWTRPAGKGADDLERVRSVAAGADDGVEKGEVVAGCGRDGGGIGRGGAL